MIFMTMSKYRSSLTQTANNFLLTDSGAKTALIFQHNIEQNGNMKNPGFSFTKHTLNQRVVFAVIFIACLLCSSSISKAQGSFLLADMGTCELQNGQVIEDCNIGYRTAGKLNTEKSNAILFPTWYGGTYQSLMPYVGPGQMLDSTKYFIIIADAFGDGISSSPSNSRTQPGKLFPEFSIADMVDAQHRLVTEKLGLDRLYAVTGISMGGMQTYQWMVSYPDFFEKAAPIVGSPKLTSYDRLVFKLFESMMEKCEVSDCPELTADVLMLEYILGFTPGYWVAETPPEAFPELVQSIARQSGNYKLHDLRSQMRAISSYDITSEFDGSLEKAFYRFKGELFITVANQDHLLLPNTSKELAKIKDSGLLELETHCGHTSFACEKDQISNAVRNFLE